LGDPVGFDWAGGDASLGVCGANAREPGGAAGGVCPVVRIAGGDLCVADDDVERGRGGAVVVYHLLHFTVKAPGVNLTGLDFGVWTHTLPDGRGTPDVYRMVIAGFSRPVVAVFYVASVGLLCWHLSHGIGAAFQSLGCKNRAWAVAIRLLSNGYALMLFLGFVAVPVAVALGFGKEALK